VQKRPISDHGDTPSLEFAYAGNMRKKYAAYMRHMQRICRVYAPHILPNSAYFFAYFASKSSAHFKKILRYKPTSLEKS